MHYFLTFFCSSTPGSCSFLLTIAFAMVSRKVIITSVKRFQFHHDQGPGFLTISVWDIFSISFCSTSLWQMTRNKVPVKIIYRSEISPPAKMAIFLCRCQAARLRYRHKKFPVKNSLLSERNLALSPFDIYILRSPSQLFLIDIAPKQGR